ncbi:hypothetical protein M089_1234 [Bacteroides ovatus str. 3725 D9 iii]|uniref:Uncharacterized protein n=1 Tax=Bacteroides ovatus (strain ATCC 8483 / DSM 1896 / JCM 5824 / BCRC 10623 / CCUG 4943 / NCTC 11153) TaxID=411476 RepID=A0AAN3A920_BACO1|nr:hypothetical protein BACOVA_02412 [Bacteroides ovatus ATCC 8483]EEO58342.1 hypothetical protein BSCG_05271 [Bacteroides sp. 2_2_4]KDS13216.1 hypothetical protein M088_2590 [Bacteroides ovatus str. 3725 D1 iv]KDS19309.1 hypothetical protein M082_3040 [Bacteroides fragilis str. 3725 D9 ii]KDS44743.1 hypothetical protein M089_1234 [Bacteroides ovatus str. 3725 D9 iii]KXT45878.1 hypothetical protein HMPREF2532_03133 [Bacteroides ovatus]
MFYISGAKLQQKNEIIIVCGVIILLFYANWELYKDGCES